MKVAWLDVAVGLVVLAALALGAWGIHIRSRHPVEEDL